MAKLLRDIAPKGHFKVDKKLEGVNKSSVSPAEPYGNNIKETDPETVKLTKKHSVQKHEDRAGNKDELFTASNIKYSMDDKRMKNFGHSNKKDKSVYEAKAVDKADAQCNHTPLGESCPIHGLKECSSMKMIKEKAPKKLAEIFKKKVEEDLAIPMLEDGKKKKKKQKMENEQAAPADGAVNFNTYGTIDQGRV